MIPSPRQTLRPACGAVPLAARICGVRAGLCYPQAMSKGEWAIQLIKIALGAAIAAYFVWWSIEVLHRLPPH